MVRPRGVPAQGRAHPLGRARASPARSRSSCAAATTTPSSRRAPSTWPTAPDKLSMERVEEPAFTPEDRIGALELQNLSVGDNRSLLLHHLDSLRALGADRVEPTWARCWVRRARTTASATTASPPGSNLRQGRPPSASPSAPSSSLATEHEPEDGEQKRRHLGDGAGAAAAADRAVAAAGTSPPESWCRGAGWSRLARSQQCLARLPSRRRCGRQRRRPVPGFRWCRHSRAAASTRGADGASGAGAAAGSALPTAPAVPELPPRPAMAPVPAPPPVAPAPPVPPVRCRRRARPRRRPRRPFQPRRPFRPRRPTHPRRPCRCNRSPDRRCRPR